MAQAKPKVSATLNRLLVFLAGIAALVVGLINPFQVPLWRRVTVIVFGLLMIGGSSMYYWPLYRKQREQMDREIDELDREMDQVDRDSR